MCILIPVYFSGTRTGYSGTSSGYLSEPEPGRSSYSERSATLDNRRLRHRNKENDFSTLPRPTYVFTFIVLTFYFDLSTRSL